MKKILLLTLGSMCAFLPAFADEDCDYTEVQQIIPLSMLTDGSRFTIQLLLLVLQSIQKEVRMQIM